MNDPMNSPEQGTDWSDQQVMDLVAFERGRDASNKILTFTSLSALAKFKKSKGYKGKKYIDGSGEVQTINTWDEFCSEMLKTPRRTIDERLKNLETFGKDFLETTQNLGLGTRYVTNLRKLPESEQQQVIHKVLDGGANKDEVKGLISELTEDLKQQKAKVEAERDSLKESLTAYQNLSTEKQQQIDQLKTNRFRAEPWQFEAHDAIAAMMGAYNDIVKSTVQFHKVREMLIDKEIDEKAQKSITYSLLHLSEQSMQFCANAYHMAATYFPAEADAPKLTLQAIEDIGLKVEEFLRLSGAFKEEVEQPED